MNSAIIKGSFLTLALLLVGLLAGAGVNRENMPDGKTLFVASNCNSCHSIAAQGIRKTGESDAPDLSGCGLRHNADWIVKYLNKQVDIDGKKHKKKWKGTSGDLATVAGWLSGLKRR